MSLWVESIKKNKKKIKIEKSTNHLAIWKPPQVLVSFSFFRSLLLAFPAFAFSPAAASSALRHPSFALLLDQADFLTRGLNFVGP